MPHANALLAPGGRLSLARTIVEVDWPLRRAAERYQVSATTAARWARRYRESGPTCCGSPATTPARTRLD